jgi:hypothetical protein
MPASVWRSRPPRRPRTSVCCSTMPASRVCGIGSRSSPPATSCLEEARARHLPAGPLRARARCIRVRRGRGLGQRGPLRPGGRFARPVGDGQRLHGHTGPARRPSGGRSSRRAGSPARALIGRPGRSPDGGSRGARPDASTAFGQAESKPVTQSTVSSAVRPGRPRVEPFHVMRLLARAGELEALGPLHRPHGGRRAGLPDARPSWRPGNVPWPRAGPAIPRPAGCPRCAGHCRLLRRRYDREVAPPRPDHARAPRGASACLFGRCSIRGSGAHLRPVLSLLPPGAAAHGGRADRRPVGPDTDYQLTAAMAERLGARRAGGVVASPSNPTGSSIAPEVLSELYALLSGSRRGADRRRDLPGFDLRGPGSTALSLGSTNDLYVINSFSKYFGMTGWRLGWLVGPAGGGRGHGADGAESLHRRRYPAQHAARAAFDPETIEILESRRAAFRRRRDRLLPALRGLGFGIPVQPTGAFYLYARLPDGLEIDSMTFTTGCWRRPASP